MNIGIIGCGLIGEKRAQALGGHDLLWAVDKDLARAEKVAKFSKIAKAAQDPQVIFSDPRVDIVIVAVTNDSLAELSIAAACAKKHVLVEKPAGRNPQETAAVVAAAVKNKVQIKAGFNHRYHPALLKARAIVDSGVLGELMFIRGRYGHGGRLGYDKEWRFKPQLSGGGELIDQGVHLIDLSRWFLGDFSRVEGRTATYFWDIPVDDNAFMTLQTDQGKTAWLQVSCTEWKNMFSFEIYGKYGKLDINGLGRSYGTEKLTYYKMLPQMGPPEMTCWEYPAPDSSWENEFLDFVAALNENRPVTADIADAHAALLIVKKIYEVNK